MKTDLSPVAVTRPGLRYLLEFARTIGEGRPFPPSRGLDDIGPRSFEARLLAADHLVESLPWKQVSPSAKPRSASKFGTAGGRSAVCEAVSAVPDPAPTYTVSLIRRVENELLLDASDLHPGNAAKVIQDRLQREGILARVDLDSTDGAVWLRDVRFRSPTARALTVLRERYAGESFVWGNVVQTSGGQQWTWLPTLLSVLPEEVLARLKRHSGSTVSAELVAATTADDIATLIGNDVDADVLARIEWPDARAMTFDQCIPIGVAILEAWFRQRAAWITNTVEVEPGVLIPTGGEKWLALDPDDLWIRMRGDRRKPKNWRNWLWNNVSSLAGLERCELRANGTAIRKGRLLDAVLDGRRIGRTSSSASSGLQQRLPEAGYATTRHFFVRVSADWAETFIPHVVDLRGQVRWGSDAIAALKERDKHEVGHWSRDDVNDYKNALTSNNYFRVDPACLVLGQIKGMSTQQQILLLAIFAEAEPKPKPRKGAKATTSEPATRNFGGSKGAGYRFDTWLSKAGYAERDNPSPADFRRFLKDLRWLAELFGFELANRQGATLSVENYLKVASQQRYWRSHVVHLRLPATASDVARSALAAKAVVDSPASHAGSPITPSPGVALMIARKSAGMTQKGLAAMLGVSHVMVSHWERGEKPIAIVHQRALTELFPGANVFGEEVNSEPELLADIAA